VVLLPFLLLLLLVHAGSSAAGSTYSLPKLGSLAGTQ
jgi:hypothetical protein